MSYLFDAGQRAQIAATEETNAMPSKLTDIGALRGVIYTRDRGQGRKTYVHFMENPPRLKCNAAGTRLFICGGTYRITKRGIEG